MTDSDPQEIDVAQALQDSQQLVQTLTSERDIAHAFLKAATDSHTDITQQLASVQQTLAAATVNLSPADRLVEAYRLVEEDKAAKKIAYDVEQAVLSMKHQNELDFIKNCTPQQVQMAGLVIGPQTTHDLIYARLRAVVGMG